MLKVKRGTQVKGTKRMETQLALRVHEDVAVRHERLLLHADACQQSAVRLAGCVYVCVSVCSCVSVCLCVCERDRERERESERARVRERDRQREREREKVCVCAFMYAQSEKGHASELCMHKVKRGTQVKGTKRMKTQLALRVHEDVAVRHERLLLHADACRQSAVQLAGCVCVCVFVCVCV